MGLHVNERKSKYMVVSSRPLNIESIGVDVLDNYTFEKVGNFKSLSVININRKRQACKNKWTDY